MCMTVHVLAVYVFVLASVFDSVPRSYFSVYVQLTRHKQECNAGRNKSPRLLLVHDVHYYIPLLIRAITDYYKQREKLQKYNYAASDGDEKMGMMVITLMTNLMLMMTTILISYLQAVKSELR